MAVSPRPGRVFTTTGLEETRDRPQSRSPSRGRRPRLRRLRRRRLRREDPITIRDSRNRSANRSDRNPWNTRHHPLLSRLSSFISSSSFSSASIEFSFLLLSSANSIETHFLIRDENPRCDRSYVSTWVLSLIYVSTIQRNTTLNYYKIYFSFSFWFFSLFRSIYLRALRCNQVIILNRNYSQSRFKCKTEYVDGTFFFFFFPYQIRTSRK